jgi:ketosteroid isomerase-like protein
MAGQVFDQAYDGRLRFVNVWRRTDGQWRLTHRNSELLPHKTN